MDPLLVTCVVWQSVLLILSFTCTQHPLQPIRALGAVCHSF
ncbi:hypothetical protein E2C01_070339 [Portunus trituberculatus]|uniref:Uncharacterized protein n=1 Tax=Portunus trituberculatus TaxID=210409 RepID=A0A5B7I200_PORTR|nr:hypothetical protein [Portunus trituberculatus]